MTTIAAVEPNAIKRRGVGLRACDPLRASPGYTLFAPTTAATGTVYLIDLEGNLFHTWQLPYRPGLYGYLTEQGTLFYNAKIPDDSFIGRTPFAGGAALEVDWKGNILWELRQPGHHHDGRRLRNGNVLLLCATEMPRDVAARVRGGRPGTEENGRIYADYLVEKTTSGETVWEWRSWEHLDPETDSITAEQDERKEWTHGNAVMELPGGNILVSFRNISTVIEIDRRTSEIVWKLGAPPLAGQHAPEPLPNGNLLIFDNGPHRLDETFPFSRVIEIEPATGQIVWKYQETPAWKFFSSRISNAQRLDNGNTLINEGLFGRFFEVTPAGEVVWEYVNPYFGAGEPHAQTNQVFRAYRYTPEQIARAQSLA